MSIDTTSLESNISWAAGHLYNATYYEAYRNKTLKPIELSILCRSYRQYRWDMFYKCKWFEFKRRRKHRKVITQLDELMITIHRVEVMGHSYDLSMYGVGPSKRVTI